MFTHALSTTIVMRSSSSSGATSGTDPITRPVSALTSGGQRNASSSASDGVMKPRVCLGQPLSSAVTVTRTRRWRIRPFFESLFFGDTSAEPNVRPICAKMVSTAK
jgi:hypothetical protein